jgi:hypothetical protein
MTTQNELVFIEASGINPNSFFLTSIIHTVNSAHSTRTDLGSQLDRLHLAWI